MDIVDIRKRKSNLEDEIVQMLNNFKTETSCDILAIDIDAYWQTSSHGRVVDNIKLDIKI